MSSQNIPLSVWLETAPGVWKYIDAFPYTGPAAPRRDVLTIPLDGITSDVVRVKLQTGLMFWESTAWVWTSRQIRKPSTYKL